MTELRRIAALDEIIVRHPQLDLAYAGIQECVARTEIFLEPVGSLLVAHGGMGKTTVCRAILRTMRPIVKERKDSIVQVVPAFYAQVPAPATVKSLAANLLTKLNDPSPLSGTVPQLTTRLCKLLRDCETKLVLLDEFHHLIDVRKRSTTVNRTVSNWIKSLVNETKVSFCLVGTPAFAPIITEDLQMARRFSRRFELQPLFPGTADRPGHLERFIQALGTKATEVVGIGAFPDAERGLFSSQIYAATQGIPAFVTMLVRDAMCSALSAQSNQVTLEDFALAWDRGICAQSTLTSENPFRLREAELLRRMRKAA